MKPLSAYSEFDMARRCAAILLTFAVIFSALLAGAYQLTKNTIAQNIEMERLKIIQNLLPNGFYDNDLLRDFIELKPEPRLGQKKSSHLILARKNNAIRAFLTEAIAPDGYGGAIRLMIAVDINGVLLGAQVLAHKETPGLGDYIAKKGDSAWIKQFQNQTGDFKIQKDGGVVTYRAGATISARAVTNAISRAVAFVNENRNAFLEGGQK